MDQSIVKRNFKQSEHCHGDSDNDKPSDEEKNYTIELGYLEFKRRSASLI